MRRDTSEPCRNHRPGGRRRRSGAGLDDVRAVSADRVAVTIGTAGRVVPISGRRLHLNHGCLIRACVRKRGRRFSGCPEPAGTLIGRQIESWACHSRHRHPIPAKCRRFPVLVARDEAPPGRPACTPPFVGVRQAVEPVGSVGGTRPPARPAFSLSDNDIAAGRPFPAPSTDSLVCRLTYADWNI